MSTRVTIPPALYRARRERAAERWRSVPRKMWSMKTWDCGSAACALGWLARWRHDGWHPGPGRPWPQWGENAEETYLAAATYFGLSASDAKRCFGAKGNTARMHGRSAIQYVGPADVARTLLTLPYVVPAIDGPAARKVAA